MPDKTRLVEINVPSGHHFFDRSEIREITQSNPNAVVGQGWAQPVLVLRIVIPHSAPYGAMFEAPEVERVLAQLAKGKLIKAAEARERFAAFDASVEAYKQNLAKAQRNPVGPPEDGQPIIIFASPGGAHA